MIKTKIKRLWSKFRGFYRAPWGYKLRLVRFGPNVSFAKKNIDVGDYTFIGARVVVGPAPVTIGRYCSIGPDALIGVNSHPADHASTSAFFYSSEWGRSVDMRQEFNKSPVLIGGDVWVGTRAIIMPGVEVGHGAIIAAGAIVTKSVPPYAIVGGVPARVIKYRYSEELITKLLREEWWESPPDLLLIEEFLRPYNGASLMKQI